MMHFKYCAAKNKLLKVHRSELMNPERYIRTLHLGNVFFFLNNKLPCKMTKKEEKKLFAN